MPADVVFGDIRNLDPHAYGAALKASGIKRIDTAARYGYGESERLIGKAKLPNDFIIDTKILFREPGNGALTPEAIEKSLTQSLESLGVDKIHILYCHAPDFETPIEVSAKALDEQYKKGRFMYLGLSNFYPSHVEEWMQIAEKEGYVKPSVFEGQYNLLCRSYEDELFPVLRKYNMRFGAYSPLGGGFLMGHLTADGVQGGNRFNTAKSQYKRMYDRPVLHEAISKLRVISAKTGISMEELSLRWLRHHSTLRDGDWVILGASQVAQIEPQVKKAMGGPLDLQVAKEMTDLWEPVRPIGKDLSNHSSS